MVGLVRAIALDARARFILEGKVIGDRAYPETVEMEVPTVINVSFDDARQSRAIYVKVDTDPKVILEKLNFRSLPKGIVSISGGAEKFPPEAIERVAMLLAEVVVPIVYEHELLVVDGGTEAGIMKITGEAFAAQSPGRHVIGGTGTEPESVSLDLRTLPLLGVAPAARVCLPGNEFAAPGDSKLEPNHLCFVLVRERDWGGEVECMFSFLDHLANCEQIPVVNIVANGGRITIKEVYHAVEKGWPVIVLEGSNRAAQLIVAALDGASERELAGLFDKYQVTVPLQEVPELVHWLGAIAKYENITRFELLSRPPQELASLILSGLGI